jgi:16S rRNA (adenine1518-N6/adenine1519-N6)-dimethyltransferase
MTRGAADVRALLKEFGLRPKKGLGQSFLVDENALRRIVEAAEVTGSDTVLEIGPGLGNLTRLLAERAGRVIAVELDEHFCEALLRLLADYPNVRIVHGDILELDPTTLIGTNGQPPATSYKVVANLPYYITSAVLRHLLEASLKPKLMVLTLQLEVAKRLIAAPGAMSLLAVSVQFYARPRLVARIRPGSFYPTPKVSSAVVRLDLYDRPPVEVDDVNRFFAIVRAGFSGKRKQLRNSLAHGLALPPEAVVKSLRRASIDEKRRAESLSLAEWGQLYRAISENKRDGLN